MTDRELLESAARAAGIRYDAGASLPHPKSGAFFGLWLVFDGEPPSDAQRYWNPLRKDGDALRLAVKLQLTVCNEHVNAGQVYCMRGDEVFPSVESGTICDGPVAEHVIPEDYAATRLAITRAAAAIGEKAPA